MKYYSVITHTVKRLVHIFGLFRQDLAVITDKDFQVLLDELLDYEAAGNMDAIVA